jgi:hypothetical protein
VRARSVRAFRISFVPLVLDGHSVGGDGRSIVLSMHELVGVKPLLGLFPSATTSSSWPFAVTFGVSATMGDEVFAYIVWQLLPFLEMSLSGVHLQESSCLLRFAITFVV